MSAEKPVCVYSYVLMLIDITFILYESQRALTFSDMSLQEEVTVEITSNTLSSFFRVYSNHLLKLNPFL